MLDERVREGEAPGPLRALLQQRRSYRIVEQIEQLRLGQVDRSREQAQIEVAADHGGCAERRARVGAQALDASSRHLAHALRQAQLGHVADHAPALALLVHDRAGLDQMANQLAREEWVAGRLARDLARQLAPLLIELVPGQSLDQAPAHQRTRGRSA